MKLNFSTKYIRLLLPLIVILTACEQSPIFYNIMQEVARRNPRIEGTPSNMVIFERDGVQTMYVGSNKLHWYAKPDDPESQKEPMKYWDEDKGRVPQPGGFIKELATTDTHLYALCVSGRSTTLKRIGNAETDLAWETIEIAPGDAAAGYPYLQRVLSAGDKIFVGSVNNTEALSGAVLYLDNADNTLKLLENDTFLLSGVVFDGNDFYFSTSSVIREDLGAMYRIQGGALPGTVEKLAKVSGSSGETNPEFLAMIVLEKDSTKNVLAMDRRGRIYTVNPSGFAGLSSTMGTFTGGSLSVYLTTENADPILLAGYQGEWTLTTTGSSYGYREAVLEWNADGTLKSVTFSEPGDSVLGDYDQYYSSLGTIPVNHMFQPPNDINDYGTVLFASTVNEGLWSFRFRDSEGKYQWNAEE